MTHGERGDIDRRHLLLFLPETANGRVSSGLFHTAMHIHWQYYVITFLETQATSDFSRSQAFLSMRTTQLSRYQYSQDQYAGLLLP